MTLRSYIVASGVALPDAVVTNDELTERLGISSEQMFKSSGIRSRRWVTEESTSSLAVMALQRALAAGGINALDVDYLLFGTMTPDRFIPGTATAIQKAAGLRQIPALDIRAACCNGLYALQLARALIGFGVALNVAICLA